MGRHQQVRDGERLTNPFVEFQALYGNDPVRFVREVLGMDGHDEFHAIDPEQEQLLRWVGQGERLISVRSGHNVGKTCCLAWVIVWQNVCRYPQRVVATAPTGGQLFGALAKETFIWLKRLPAPLYELFDVKSEGFVLRADKDDSNTEFRTSRAETPEALAGVHADRGWVLLIADEASGVPDAVFEAASGSMAAHNAQTILAGNPVRLTGLFHQTQTKLRDRWKTLHISCVGHRRISPAYIEDMKHRYGEDSNAYRVRVLGEFPRADNDAVVSLELAEAALRRDVGVSNVRAVWGLDVGGGGKGGDPSALAKRKGNWLLEPVRLFAGLETMQLVGRVKQEYDATPVAERPEVILVDVIGLGAGVVSRMQELDLPVRGINVGETPAMKEQFVNLKAELWMSAREWFEARDCRLTDEVLVAELCAVNFHPPTSNGKTRIEEKKLTRARLGRSPDRADAFVLTFAAHATFALFGATVSHSWKESLQRNVTYV